MEKRTDEMKEFYDDMKNMLDSTSLVTARMIDAIVNNSQLASSITPEMQDLFDRWMDCISGEVKRKLLSKDSSSATEVKKLADEIGISVSSVLSIALYLHRRGDISIEGLTVKKGRGSNTEICNDLK